MYLKNFVHPQQAQKDHYWFLGIVHEKYLLIDRGNF